MRSYGVFHPACRDEILLLALAKHVHFSHATQLSNDFGVFLYLFARKSIALATYLTLLYSTNMKLKVFKVKSVKSKDKARILIGKQLRGEITGRRDVPLSGII